jgi:hypothetical protein
MCGGPNGEPAGDDGASSPVGGRGSAVVGGSRGDATGGAHESGGGFAGAGAGGTAPVVPGKSCSPSPKGGTAQVGEPMLVTTLFDRWHEAWLASPAIVDLDGDGTNEIIVPRDDVVLIWNPSGELLHKFEVPGRVWAPPVVLDLRQDLPGLEVAVASRGQVFAWDAAGAPLSGFPFTWRDEMRAIAGANLDGKGDPELVMVTTSDLEANGQTDILMAIHSDASIVEGFPPNTTGASGCDDACYVHAGFDQTLALGDLDGDKLPDILAPQDNAYVSLHSGSGRAFDVAPLFKGRTKFSGIRFMLDYAEAQQGWAEDEQTANQAHFTNSPPAIADVFGDGTKKLVMLSSVQNAAQDDRERGVALWVVNPDGTRPLGWEAPFHAQGFLDGLWDPGDNIVATTNQVTVLDLDGKRAGLDFIFAGFDGQIHAVSGQKEELWHFTFTTEPGVFTGGVAAADLSGDGLPELIFTTYSTQAGKGELFVLSTSGAQLHRIPLPDRGAMPVPTIADVDSDGQLEIVVSLKDAVDKERQVFIFTVPGSATNCLPWPTGRANLARTGSVE